MLEIIKAIVWAVATVFIIVFGIYFSIKLSFPQFNLKKTTQSLKSDRKSLKTLYLTLGGRIGVGSIAGVALAIYIGGPGTIFWMWVLAFVSGSLSYSETLLGIKYKTNYGGPSYYIKKYSKKLAILYSIVVVISYLLGFIPIQANTIARSLNMVININNIFIGIILFLLIFVIVKGGINKIMRVTNIIVPFMVFLYVLISFIIVIINFDKFIIVIKLIIVSAFKFKSFFSGFLSTVIIGIQRGIFSNEAGLGLGSIAASSYDFSNGCISGYIQTLGIYITTLLICTSTAFIILIFNYQSIVLENINGIEITFLAFKYHFGNIGTTVLITSILLFSFTTILTGYYYCESSIKYLYKKFNLKFLKLIVPCSVLLGAITSPTVIWKYIDIFVGTLSIINIYALYKMRKEIIDYHKKYDRI